MKKLFFTLLITACSAMAVAQDFDVFTFIKSGTFGKQTILKDMNKLAIPQATIIFKTATTKDYLKNERGGLLGGRKSGGGTVTGKITAYLEITDGELTQEDYQLMADQFYGYLTKRLNENGIGTVDWNTITQKDFYQAGDDAEEEDKTRKSEEKKGQIYTMVNANKGKTVTTYDPSRTFNFGFAGMKIKRAANFSEELGAPILFLHTVVDFVDLMLEGDVHTGSGVKYEWMNNPVTKTDFGLYEIKTSFKNYEMNAKAAPNVKVAGWTTWDGKSMGGRLMFQNDRSKTDTYMFNADIPSFTEFATELTQDPNRKVLNKRENIFAKDIRYVPVVVATTKAKYMNAVQKALENFADALIYQVKLSKKS
jgi:hypothetical protein